MARAWPHARPFAAGAAFAQQAPIDLAPAAAAEKPAKSAKTAAAAPSPAAEAVARANAWLDAARVMTADFVQVGPDGRRSEGELSVERPGRMRFEYTEPARFEIVADGRSVAVIDRKLDTQDEYFIAQTPLKFLLADHIDIARDTRVLSVADEGNAVTIEIEDRAALGGTAHLTLVFDASTFALRRWTVIDAQGFQTVVTLSNLDLATRPDPALFHIDELPANRLDRGRWPGHPRATLSPGYDAASAASFLPTVARAASGFSPYPHVVKRGPAERRDAVGAGQRVDAASVEEVAIVPQAFADDHAAGRARRRPHVQPDLAARVAEPHDVALAQSELRHVAGMH